MVRRLHPTSKPKNIIYELRNRRFKILESVKRKVRTPLLNGEDVQKVFYIAKIQGMRATNEALRKSRIVPQKNAEESNEMTKCVSCSQNHPASYRGCDMAKKTQKIKNDLTKAKREKSTLRSITNQNPYMKHHNK